MNLKQVIMRLNAVGYEELQDVRKKFMSQVRDIIYKRDQGIAFDETEDKKEQKTYGSKYNDSKLLPLAKDLIKRGEILPEEGKYLVDIFLVQIPLIKQLEREYKKRMEKLVQSELIYNEFLAEIRGIGKVLSVQIVKAFGDCSQYDTVSRLWAHCGLSVVDGKAVKLRKGKEISFNPKLRALTWIVSDCLMKQNKGYYRQIYDTEKEKQLNNVYAVGYLEMKYGKPYKSVDINLTKLHAHNRALRKMRKIFLDHYWHASRELIGLEAKKNYIEGVLGHKHIITWKDAIQMEGDNEE